MNSIDIGTSAPRKFVAATSREALRLARRAVGEDAMVLASRATGDGFEVVVIGEGRAAQLVEAAAPLTATAAAKPQAPDSVLSELHSMRSMLEERLDTVAWNEGQRRDPVRGRLLRTMLQAGFSAKLTRALLGQLPAGQSYAEGLAFVRSELARATPVHEDEEAMLARGGVYALVGPTGVGKTTTTAKLAARCVMRFGPEKLALVTTDGYRIGAYEQLRIYGQILGVPVYAVKDQANLATVLHELQDRHMVLIDTVGMSQRDRAVADQIAMLCGAGRQVKRLLLLNAASQGDTLNEVVKAYQHAAPGNELAGCIFTKLDEATSHGALLDTVIRHKLPVYYMSNGQKVPENLVTVERTQLVDEVLSRPKPGALFVFDPDLAAAAAAPSEEIARATAEADRLRQQYGQLIRAMAHDAQEISDAAQHLARADVGFAAARRLWTGAGGRDDNAEAVLQTLLELARSDAGRTCDGHVLALCGRAKLDPSAHGDVLDLQSCVLLSDRTGLPFAAPNQWLATGGDPKSAARQLQWLRQQEFGRPLVHLLPRLPSAEDLSREALASQGIWLARASGSTPAIDAASGASMPLSQLRLQFGPAQACEYRGRPAARSDAEAAVRVKVGNGSELSLRCVVRRVLDADGKAVEHTYLLSNAHAQVTSTQLAQWQEWALRADSCFRLASKGVSLLGGIAELAAPATTTRLLVAGQVATTVWRVMQASGERVERTRLLLTELAGRPVRMDRPQSGASVYEGLSKLFQLLEALLPESGEDASGGSVA